METKQAAGLCRSLEPLSIFRTFIEVCWLRRLADKGKGDEGGGGEN